MSYPKIYISHFQPSFRIQTDTLIPIQVGAALSSIRLPMMGDDTGDNISTQNPAYCELTAHYWAWKNDKDSSHLGFFHYRRLLDMAGHKKHPKDGPHGIMVDHLGHEERSEFGLVDDHIRQAVSQNDLIVPRPYNVNSLGCKSLEDQYKRSPNHHHKDFDLARKVVLSNSPDYSKYFEDMASGTILYQANIFIASREIFHRYCLWIFETLAKIEASIDLTNYNASEKRAIGYLAERLTTVFILKERAETAHLRIKELPLIILTDTRPQPHSPPLPVSELPVVTVVASSDESYAPHLSALVTSVFQNASQARFIDFIVLGDTLTTATQNEIRRSERWHPHCRVSFVTMDRMYSNLSVHGYFARSTFYRLGMSDVLADRDRVVFLDTDMIVLDDIAILFDTDLQGNLVAACRDLIMSSFRVMGVSSMLEAGGMPASLYLSDKLALRNREHEYFQAGTMILDLRAIRETSISSAMVSDLSRNTYWFLDQDVLNKHLVGKVSFLPEKWNSVFIDENHLKFLPAEDRVKHLQTQNSPSIAHFAGVAKPWKNDLHPLGSYYWLYLRHTLWYEKILIERMSGVSLIGKSATTDRRSLPKKILAGAWRALPQAIRSRLFPLARFLARTMR